MLFKRIPILIITTLCFLSMYNLFYIKDNVKIIKKELKEVKIQIDNEIDAIHLLTAELTYLSSPSRLKQLNDKYLKLSDTNMEQMIADPLVDIEQEKPDLLNKNSKHKKYVSNENKQVKWRYKKGPEKYLMISNKK